MADGFESPFPVAVSQVGPNEWQLTHELVYHAHDRVIRVPVGQTTDFASVPSIITWMVPSTTGVAAAVTHDHLWRVRVPDEMSYRDADRILRQALRALGVDPFTCWLAWVGVRWGALTRGRAGRRGWHRDAPAVLAITVPLVVIAAPTLLLLPSLAVIWVCKRITGTFTLPT